MNGAKNGTKHGVKNRAKNGTKNGLEDQILFYCIFVLTVWLKSCKHLFCFEGFIYVMS